MKRIRPAMVKNIFALRVGLEEAGCYAHNLAALQIHQMPPGPAGLRRSRAGLLQCAEEIMRDEGIELGALRQAVPISLVNVEHGTNAAQCHALSSSPLWGEEGARALRAGR